MTLRRHHPDLDDDAFAPFAEDVRAAVPSEPSEETAQRHLAAMRAAAEEPRSQVVEPAVSGARRRRSAGPARPVVRLAGLAAGAVVAFSGTSTVLAAAGVDLPDPVRAPFEAVGVDLPNQTSESERERTAPADEQVPASGGDERDADRSRSDEAPGRRDDERRSGKGRDRSRADEAPGRRDPQRRSGERDRGNGSGGNAGGSSPGNAGGHGNANGRDGAPAAPQGTPKPKGTSGRPANPAPKGSAQRGAGPKRPIKPSPSRERATKRRPVQPATPRESLPAPEPAPAPVPEQTTTTP